MRLHALVNVSTATLGLRARALATATTFAALALSSGCSSEDTPSEPGTAGSGGTTTTPTAGSGSGATGGSTPGTAGTGTGGSGATAGQQSMGGAASTGGSAGMPSATGGSVAMGGMGGQPNSSGAGGVSPGGSGGGGLPLPTPTNLDHCLYGYDKLPSDATMAHGPALYTPPGGGSVDTILQPEVLQWMEDNRWTGAHVVWHAVRGCNIGTAAGLLRPLGFPDICSDYPVLVPTDQNCRTAGDGYQFLLFHRHMIETLKQLWPDHAADFDGFPKFPTTKEELPEVWNTTDPRWNAQVLAAAEIADNIEMHLDKFPDEGSLGYWLQCPVGSQPLASAPQMPYVGLHFNLHDQWSRGPGTAHGLNNGQVNITNYMFWKLHGWIDKVWEKYRVAKGLTEAGSPAMQKYRQDLAAQCYEMDIEIEILKQRVGDGPMLDCPPDVDETGEFHTKVRPIFETDENHCSSCHGPAQTSPYVGLTLGGQISSKCIVERLKRDSVDGGQFKLVVPGDPDNSWLYLKAAGKAAEAGCVTTDPNKVCNTATMPPTGRTMTDAELEILRKWIADGANYP